MNLSQFFVHLGHILEVLKGGDSTASTVTTFEPYSRKFTTPVVHIIGTDSFTKLDTKSNILVSSKFLSTLFPTGYTHNWTPVVSDITAKTQGEKLDTEKTTEGYVYYSSVANKIVSDNPASQTTDFENTFREIKSSKSYVTGETRTRNPITGLELASTRRPFTSQTRTIDTRRPITGEYELASTRRPFTSQTRIIGTRRPITDQTGVVYTRWPFTGQTGVTGTRRPFISPTEVINTRRPFISPTEVIDTRRPFTFPTEVIDTGRPITGQIVFSSTRSPITGQTGITDTENPATGQTEVTGSVPTEVPPKKAQYMSIKNFIGTNIFFFVTM